MKDPSPYYALFIQSVQEYMGESFVAEECAKQIKNIRDYIKALDTGFGKSKKKINEVDEAQDKEFRSQLRFDFMKTWNIHYNLGTYWTSDKHVLGNTQMYADYLGVEKLDSDETGKKLFNLGYQCGSFVSSIKKGFSEVITPPVIKREITGTKIEYYCDLNTNKKESIFTENNKTINLFCLYLASNMNFIKFILSPLFSGVNPWIFRVEYVVTYYTYRALQRLKSHCENNKDIIIDMNKISEVLDLEENIFQSRFRNCMMHYGLQNKELITLENIENPLYGIVETCFDGMDLNTYYSKLRNLGNTMIQYLESYIDETKVNLQKL